MSVMRRPPLGRSVRRTAALAVVVAALGLMPPRVALAATAPAVPASLAVPAGHVLAAVGHARGYQIYVCQAQGGGYAWVLQAPWAGLFDGNGNSLAVHYAGPSWTAADGTTVVAARIASAPAPSGGAIPWLLLQSTSTSGPAGGTFSGITYIQRINTVGGLAPASGCDAEHVGALAPVYYTADYYFYRAG